MSDPHDSHAAPHPGALSAAQWKDVAVATWKETKADNVPLLAAGVAFFALLALVPALVALVSIYGLVADPEQVERQVSDLLGAAPQEVRRLIETQLQSVVESSNTGIGFGAAFGLLLALWSASNGMRHMIAAVNAAYDETESRTFLRQRALALVMTLGAIVFLAVAFGVIALLPALLDGTRLSDVARSVIGIARWPLLALSILVGLAVLYRYAPNRDEPRWQWVSVGAVVATALWVLASLAFSVYAANFGRFNETYGSLGAVVVVMLWLFLTAFVVIGGAELNSVLEQRRGRPGVNPGGSPRSAPPARPSREGDGGAPHREHGAATAR